MRLTLAAAMLLLGGCHLLFPHAGPGARPDASADGPTVAPPDLQPLLPAIDLLFVIDNSGTMAEEQKRLTGSFDTLLKALTVEGALPDLRVGVVSTDLGAGPYNLPSCEVQSGDGGKLQATASSTACTAPSGLWIEHAGGKTNVPSPAPDPATQLREAFACIAELGTGGCGFEQPLAAARRALDPQLDVNPGFLRPGARLAIVFLADEDDCSAANPGLYDPSANALGPLTSFRCARHGYSCEEPLDTIGPKADCQPDGSWLEPVAGHVSFFAGLKPSGQLAVAVIAGPAGPVEVTLTGGSLELKPSCQSGGGVAAPALRLAAFVKGIAASGQIGIFNEGLDEKDQLAPVNVCSDDYGPALRLLGKKLAGTL
jgi:hypothetical protein